MSCSNFKLSAFWICSCTCLWPCCQTAEPASVAQKRKAKLSLEAKRRVYDETVQEAGFGHTEISGAPKVLGDIVEALAAAVYLDSGRNLELTWQVCGVGVWSVWIERRHVHREEIAASRQSLDGSGLSS